MRRRGRSTTRGPRRLATAPPEGRSVEQHAAGPGRSLRRPSRPAIVRRRMHIGNTRFRVTSAARSESPRMSQMRSCRRMRDRRVFHGGAAGDQFTLDPPSTIGVSSARVIIVPRPNPQVSSAPRGTSCAAADAPLGRRRRGPPFRESRARSSIRSVRSGRVIATSSRQRNWCRRHDWLNEGASATVRSPVF